MGAINIFKLAFRNQLTILPGRNFTSAPATATLNASNPIGTFQINNGTTDILSTVYIMGSVTTMLTGTLTKTSVGQSDRYLISNVSISFTSCPSLLTIKADVWASQSGNGRIVHCINGGLELILPSSNFNLTSLYFCDDQNTRVQEFNKIVIVNK